MAAAAAVAAAAVTRTKCLKIIADYLLQYHIKQVRFIQHSMQNFHHKIGIRN
jgi:hypothetical protein